MGEVEKKRTGRPKIIQFITNKKFYIPVALIIVTFVLLFLFVKPVRYAVLNMFASAKADITVVDASTSQPLAQATLTIQGRDYTTNDSGKISLSDLDFGDAAYTVQKDAYAPYQSSITLDLGTTAIGPVALRPTGTPLEVSAVNTLSGEALNNYKITLAGTTTGAQGNDRGIAVLSVPPQIKKATIVIEANGFNTTSQEIVLQKVGKKNVIKASLTPSGKYHFLSNRSGRVDVYSSDLNGSNQQLVIKGGPEHQYETIFSISPDKKYGILTSTRENLRGSDGDIQPALYIVDFTSRQAKRVDEGVPNYMQIGWADNSTFAYYVFADDYTKVKTVSVPSGTLTTLVKAKQVYSIYTYEEEPSHAYYTIFDETPERGFYSVDLLKKTKKRVSTQALYDFVHLKPFAFYAKLGNSWRQFDLNRQSLSSSTPPASRNSKSFYLSSNKARIAWIEDRDGQGVVFVGDAQGNAEKKVPTSLDAGMIMGWVEDKYLIVRSFKDNTSVDYIVHIGTGKTTKISPVYTSLRGYY